jgi:hypothetical protein
MISTRVPSAEYDGDDGTLAGEIRAVVRTGTLLKRIDSRADETWLLHDGSGGTYLGGAPYIERNEEWPICAHGVAMQHELQVDSRDALHAPAIDGLFVVFVCRAPIAAKLAFLQEGRTCGPLVRHYPEPLAQRRQEHPFDAGAWASQLVPTRVAEFLPGSDLMGMAAPALVERLDAAHGRAAWQRAYFRMMDDTGMGSSLYEDHLGGWHVPGCDRDSLPPPCLHCGEQLRLVVQLEWGDGNRSLWACAAHPQNAHFAFHK